MDDTIEDLQATLGRIKQFWCVFDVQGLERRTTELERLTADPELWQDQRRAQDLMRELSEARETVSRWRGFQTRAKDLITLAELAQDEDADDLAADLGNDASTLDREVGRLEFELTFNGPYDQRGAVLAIHAGAGGTQSQDWAEMLLRMYLRWAERRGFQAEIFESTEGEEAGLKSVTVEVRGPRAYGYLRSERGVHRLVRLSPFDASHARHTSFALVEVMPEVDEGSPDIEINPDDLRVDVYRASGHGGQNVQKNSTAIRITHLPTGIVVTCQNERSQYRNKQSAMKVLESRLLEIELESVARSRRS